VGFLIGLHRAGWRGALAAWLAFTLPSAVLMYAFAMFAPTNPGPRIQAAAVVGLLAAALYDPLWVGAVRSVVDVAIILIAIVLLLRFKAPPIAIAALCVAASLAKSLMAS
jgi:chromate transporter